MFENIRYFIALLVIMSAVLRGFVDSLKGTVVLFYLDIDIRERKAQQSPVRDKNVPPVRRQERESRTSIKKEEEPRVLKRTLQCCMLNGGVFWCSILIFDYGLLPFLKYLLTIVFGHSEIKQSVWSWMKLFLSCTFGALWVLPLFVLSRIVNSLWFQDIADSAYRHRRGRPQLLPGVSKLIADMLFSVMVQALFLVQSVLVSMLPIVLLGDFLCLIHMCMLYSLYAFEYRWCNMGWELHRRLTFIETNWPYFIGFGLPLAVLTALASSYIVRIEDIPGCATCMQEYRPPPIIPCYDPPDSVDCKCYKRCRKIYGRRCVPCIPRRVAPDGVTAVPKELDEQAITEEFQGPTEIPTLLPTTLNNKATEIVSPPNAEIADD